MSSESSKLLKQSELDFRKMDISHDEKPKEDDILPTIIHHLPPAMVEQARTELNETDEVRPKALDDFRRLIETDKKLITPTDDAFLLAFLRARKFNVKKSFTLLQKFWSFRKELRDIFDRPDEDKVMELIYKNFLGVLKLRDRKGCAVFIFKVALWNPEEFPIDILMQAIGGALMFATDYPVTQIAGYRMIFDTRGVSWSHLKHFTPSNVILLIRSTQFCFPGRFKGIDVLSDSKLITFFTTLIYPLLTWKLKNRIKFHGGYPGGIKEHIHPSVLPEEFGGEAEVFSNSGLKWTEAIESASKKLLKLNTIYGYKD